MGSKWRVDNFFDSVSYPKWRVDYFFDSVSYPKWRPQKYYRFWVFFSQISIWPKSINIIEKAFFKSIFDKINRFSINIIEKAFKKSIFDNIYRIGKNEPQKNASKIIGERVSIDKYYRLSFGSMEVVDREPQTLQNGSIISRGPMPYVLP
jgi:hypothetical protein